MSCPYNNKRSDNEKIRLISRSKPSEPLEFPDYHGKDKCTWDPKKTSQVSPHVKLPQKTKGLILDSVLDAIGNTPLIRCSRITKQYNIQCEVLAKCEYFNAGGSVKDRIGLRMIEEAEQQGRLLPGDYIIEPTSGNTGMGLALTAAIKGYKVLITLPEKMSGEKVNMMKALGAQILRTPTEAAWNAPESHIGLALRLNKALERSHILDQYKNVANPMAHYMGTGSEIVQQCGDKAPDAIVICAGTGGTLTGIARRIKESYPECIVVGVDPHGSILAQPESLNNQPTGPYEIEGIGYDFIPSVLDRSVVDRWVKTADPESFEAARNLIRYEGFLCGGSSGSAFSGVVKFIKEMGWENDPTKRIVTVLPDSSRNYMSKFVADEWMIERGFMQNDEEDEDSAFCGKTVADLKLPTPVTVTPEATCGEVAKILMERGFDQIPVVSSATGSSEVIGVVTEGNLTLKLSQKKCSPGDSVLGAVYKKFFTVPPNCPLSRVSRILDASPFVLVGAEQEVIGAGGVSSVRKSVVGLVTRFDLLKFLTESSPTSH